MRDQRCGVEMTGVALQWSAGDLVLDTLLRDLIGRIEATFSGRRVSYFLVGSYAERAAVQTSDVDLVIILRGPVHAGEVTVAEAAATSVSSSRVIDVDVVTYEDLVGGGVPLTAIRLRTASVLLYGDDLRAELPLPPLDQYRRLVTPAPYINFVQLLRGHERNVYPLTYPDPSGPFLGYDSVRLSNRYSPDGRGFKDLVNGVAWAATALVALRSGDYIAGKEAARRSYHATIDDEWAALIADIYSLCRIRWAYLIPADPRDQAVLRALCARVLDFENHYFACYRDYLLAELLGADEAGRIFAVHRLREVLYSDEAIRLALHDAARSSEPTLRAAALDTLSVLSP